MRNARVNVGECAWCGKTVYKKIGQRLLVCALGDNIVPVHLQCEHHWKGAVAQSGGDLNLLEERVRAARIAYGVMEP